MPSRSLAGPEEYRGADDEPACFETSKVHVEATRENITTLATGTGINIAGFIVRVFAVFFHSLIAARLFGAEALGVYSLGLSAVLVLSRVSQLGLPETATRYVSMLVGQGSLGSVKRIAKRLLLIAVPVALVIALIMIIGAHQLAGLFGEPSLAPSLRILSVAVVALTVATLLGSVTQGLLRLSD